MNCKKEYRDIHRIACPILWNYLMTSVFEILDKAVVGHYSVQGFAVVGVAASMIYAVTGALGILSVAFNIMAAEEKGRQNERRFAATFVMSKRLALVIGGCFFVLSIVGGRWFFREVYGIFGEELSELLRYFYPAAFTVGQNMLIFQYSAYFRNCLNTKITLLSTVVSTVVNLFFDVSLVYGLCGLPKLGTAGAAWGSVIGLAAGLLVYQCAYYKKNPLYQEKARMKDFSEKWEVVKKFWSLYPPLLGQEFLENTLFVLVVSGVISGLGTEQMASYHLLDTVGGMIGLPIYAYATATQTFALQTYSAGKQNMAKRYLRSGVILTCSVVAVLSFLCGTLQKKIFYWIVADMEVIAAAGKVLGWVIVVQFLKIPYQIHMSYLQGIGKERFVFLCTAFGTLAASAGTVILGNRMKLPGVYLMMSLELLILTEIYRKA